MVRGLIKKILISFSFLSIFLFINEIPAFSYSLPIPKSLYSCVDNAVAPLTTTKDIQTYLNCNGFNPGPIDGKSGSKTKAAIKAFQTKNGLLSDGIVGNRTKSAMRAYTGCSIENTCKARNNTSAKLDSVEDIQTYLSNNGFNPGIIDGKIGSYTREAIKAFQRKVGLIPDGVVGNRTKAEMRSYTGC